MTAEKIARFFQERSARADFEAFDRIMMRPNSAPPVEGDELPSTDWREFSPRTEGVGT
jgi:hypothetical protein